jgi:hypothetical protein
MIKKKRRKAEKEIKKELKRKEKMRGRERSRLGPHDRHKHQRGADSIKNSPLLKPLPLRLRPKAHTY